jgi:hypothetical protein
MFGSLTKKAVLFDISFKAKGEEFFRSSAEEIVPGKDLHD